jgi:hypothetical protein
MLPSLQEIVKNTKANMHNDNTDDNADSSPNRGGLTALSASLNTNIVGLICLLSWKITFSFYLHNKRCK